MKALRVAMAFMLAVASLAIAVAAYAATARVRCEVEPDRLRIRVDGMDLPAGTYIAELRRVRNDTDVKMTKTETGKEQIQSAAIGDVDLDFDSTADPTDSDSFISQDFAQAGDTVTASVVQFETNEMVAAASTTCIAK